MTGWVWLMFASTGGLAGLLVSAMFRGDTVQTLVWFVGLCLYGVSTAIVTLVYLDEEPLT